jgi:hypothetical protein
MPLTVVVETPRPKRVHGLPFLATWVHDRGLELTVAIIPLSSY